MTLSILQINAPIVNSSTKTNSSLIAEVGLLEAERALTNADNHTSKERITVIIDIYFVYNHR